jgi:Putative collagen-binding domain of a collagenase
LLAYADFDDTTALKPAVPLMTYAPHVKDWVRGDPVSKDVKGKLYLVYLPRGGTTDLDLSGTTGQFAVQWFDPRNGGALKRGSVTGVTRGSRAALGAPPDNRAEDWLVVVRR